MDYDAASQDDPIGCGVLCVGALLDEAAANNGAASFEVELIQAGVRAGRLSGRARVSPGPPTSAAALQRAKARAKWIGPEKPFSIRGMLAGGDDQAPVTAPAPRPPPSADDPGEDDEEDDVEDAKPRGSSTDGPSSMRVVSADGTLLPPPTQQLSNRFAGVPMSASEYIAGVLPSPTGGLAIPQTETGM